jgi:UDP-N-acetylmuramoylalanine--D-glutamate ligase
MSYLAGKNATVVGMGLSGVAAAQLLRAEGAKVAVTDDKSERDLGPSIGRLRELDIDYHLGGIDSELLLCSDLAVISPGVPSNLSPLDRARKAGVEVISEIELASSLCDAPIIATTGTNGKTTTTALIHRMADRAGLKAALAGNNEIPFSDVVRENSVDLIALEVSSFQLENIKDFRPMVALVLNVSPDHLDRYRGMEDYIAAKKRLFSNQAEGDFAVLNSDDSVVAAMAREVKSEILWFSAREETPQGAFLRGTTLVARFRGVEAEVMEIDDIPLIGWHNVENTLAAIAATLPVELSLECYRDALAGFPAAEHRLEKVRELDGVLYINDSKATNIDALAKSLESFNSPLILIAGGRGKKSSYRVLRPLVEARVKAIITIGEDAQALEEAFGDLVSAERAESMPEAVRFAAAKAEPGDCVLLAPACASFDMFKSYAHRGEVFKEAVQAL